MMSNPDDGGTIPFTFAALRLTVPGSWYCTLGIDAMDVAPQPTPMMVRRGRWTMIASIKHDVHHSLQSAAVWVVK